MEMSEEDLIDLLAVNTSFSQPDDRRPSAVEQQFLPASLDQDGWTVSLSVGWRAASRAKNHDFQSRI
jgi:hypothetical protein